MHRIERSHSSESGSVSHGDTPNSNTYTSITIHKCHLPTITGVHIIPYLSTIRSRCLEDSYSTGVSHSDYYSPGTSSKRPHCHGFVQTALGRTALRQVSTVDEEEEYEDDEEEEEEEEEEETSELCSSKLRGREDHRLAAQSYSMLNTLWDKSEILRRPISLILPHAKKVINWATRPRQASSVPFINIPADFEEGLYHGGVMGAESRFDRGQIHGHVLAAASAGNGLVEDLPINKKPAGGLLFGASVLDNVIFRGKGFRTNSTRSVPQPLVAQHGVPSVVQSQLLPSQNSYRHQRQDSQGDAWDSQARLSVSTVGDVDALRPPRRFPDRRGVGGGGGGGGEASVTGTSFVSARSMIQGSVLTFRDVQYVVPVKKMLCSKVVKRVVLDGVSGIMRPGVNAIMGPTGCGKSSLLDTLAGRKDPRYLSGEVLVDGHPQPKYFKCISGYVVQDDILMGTLTVRETLYLAAMLRRKKGFTKAETHQKINEILEELGLTKIADNKIGSEFIRGISGGERKRTSIGMEIIADPSVLFLDEPTTGLDAFTAGSVIQTLKTLSRRGRTIVVSIHQPKYSIYKLFDSLTLMSNGKIVYQGMAHKEPMRYFAKLGYVCEDHNNPPDFFLDILHGEAKPIDNVPDKGDFESDSEDSHERMKAVADQLVNTWSESPECLKVRDEVLAAQSRSTDTTGDAAISERISFPASYARQMNIVCWRTFIGLMRDPQASIVQTVVYLFFAVSMGVVYFGLDSSLESGIQNRTGLFFFATLQVVFVNIGAIELFLRERVLFIHEHSSGYYRISAYFFAKLICDILPTKALPVFFFMPITYWMAGLVPSVGNFFFFELILVLGTVAASATAMAVSASVALFSIANVIISIIFVFMMVFGGFLINLKKMTPWLSWLRYLSIFNYTFGGLLVNELSHLEFCPTTNRTSESFNDTRSCVAGGVYLDDMGFPYQQPWDFWENALGLFGICIVCFTVCYIQLRRINTFK